jgi:tetratricopeptide (TPR) repeat protein
MPIAKTPCAMRVFWSFVLCAALSAAPLVARAQSDEAVDKVTKMNKKAVEEYENLNFEESRKILKEALDYCAQNGLDKHPVKARTHIHLGIVILAGFKQREVAIKQFRKALEIQPDIKLTKSLANPEVQEAFDEAVAGMGQPEKPDNAGKAADQKTDKAADQKTDKADKPADGGPISHDAIAEGTQGGTITVTAKVDVNLDVKKMILAYRPDGASEFLGRVMKEVTQGNWTADIPATATAGNRVAYYLEAQGADDNTLGTKGTADDPMIIALKGSGAPEKGKASGDGDKDDDDNDDGPHWFLGLGLGSGIGYAKGNGEVNADSKVTGSFASASLGHLAPELGYFVKPNVLLSLQLRLQLVSGVNGRVLDPTDDSCGSDHFCSPAKSAFAAFAKVAYLFGENAFHPYLSGAVGGGQIRHVAKFPTLTKCGSSGTSPGTDVCDDTILAGPVFVGPGGGVIFNASDNFALTLGLNTQLGFPDFTFNFDLNLGVALEF